MLNTSSLHLHLLVAALLCSCCSCQSALTVATSANSPGSTEFNASALSVPASFDDVAMMPRTIQHHSLSVDRIVTIPEAPTASSTTENRPALTVDSTSALSAAGHAAETRERHLVTPAFSQATVPSGTTYWLAQNPTAAPGTEETSDSSVIQASVDLPIITEECSPTDGPTCSIDGTCIPNGIAGIHDCPSDPVDMGWAEGCQILPVEAPLYLADEYLCDGGDRETRVRVSRDWRVSGLDTEDTIAHYDTLDGRVVVTPSNSVCIYAPRFAAIRKVVQTSEDGLALVMQEVDTPAPPNTALAVNEAIKVHQPLMPGRDDGLHAARGLLHRVRGLDQLHALRVGELTKDFETYEDFQVIHTGIHRSSERALLEQWGQAAVIWDETVAPEVILDGEPAAIDTTVEKTATIRHYELQGKPRLRVIKLASRKSAKPGEEVMFTLRFDNIGEQTVGNVTIMDNLTTRLEYVPDSAECDLDAEFFSDPNQGDSLALRWEIKEPLKPGDGGIIRFRCKVR